MPSLAFSNVWGKEMHEYDHRPAYIVLNDAHYRLAVYRIRPCGRLRLLRHCPKKIGMLEGALEIFRELEQLDRIEAAEAFTFKQLARA